MLLCRPDPVCWPAVHLLYSHKHVLSNILQGLRVITLALTRSWLARPQPRTVPRPLTAAHGAQEVTLFLRVLGCYPAEASPQAPPLAALPAPPAASGYARGVADVLNGSNAVAIRTASMAGQGVADVLAGSNAMAHRVALTAGQLPGQVHLQDSINPPYHSRQYVCVRGQAGLLGSRPGVSYRVACAGGRDAAHLGLHTKLT